jgi:hypothetical protein
MANWGMRWRLRRPHRLASWDYGVDARDTFVDAFSLEVRRSARAFGLTHAARSLAGGGWCLCT